MQVRGKSNTQRGINDIPHGRNPHRHQTQNHRAPPGRQMRLQQTHEQGISMSKQRCVFSRIQEQFDAEDLAALDMLLQTRGHLTIAREMTAAGYPMSEHTVRRHRKQDCSCGRVAA
jgi:hypothetical protein